MAASSGTSTCMRLQKTRLEITKRAAHAILEQADYYSAQENESLAQRWEEAVDDVIHSLLKMPERGSPCNFKHPHLQNLRRMPVSGFAQHLIFYSYIREEHLVHVIHGARDIEGLLAAL